MASVATAGSAPRAISVFDDLDRTLVGGAPYLLSHFDYLNTSNRPEADRVRALVDSFLGRYPEGDRDRLRDRLRSIDDIGHLGAFFELALHELLVRAGCCVEEIEPAIENSRRVPDFLVETPSGDRLYLEAALATGRSQTDAAARKRLEQAFKIIDSVHSRLLLQPVHVGDAHRDDYGQEVEARARAMARGARL
jgi:hypothetical protein